MVVMFIEKVKRTKVEKVHRRYHCVIIKVDSAATYQKRLLQMLFVHKACGSCDLNFGVLIRSTSMYAANTMQFSHSSCARYCIQRDISTTNQILHLEGLPSTKGP